MSMIIDTHCHAGLDKYGPIASLVDQMFRHHVDRAVLVQHLGQDDNQYLVDCMASYPDRFAIVALVNVARDDAPIRLAHWASQPGVRGVRLHARERSPGKNPWAIWEAADKLGLSVSLNGHGADYSSAETLALAQRFPNLTLVVEHLGRTGFADVNGEEFQRILRLADLPKVLMKISGFHLLGVNRAAFYPEATPFIRAALSAFGPERCMWATNFPPVHAAEGYGGTLVHARQHWPWQNDNERRLVMGETAARVYGLQ